MTSYKMNATKRDQIGSNKVNKLRTENQIPGVLYKKGENTESLQVDLKEFQQVFKHAGSTSVIDLNLGGQDHSVIVREVQTHPVKQTILHIDFLELNMDEILKVHIPVNLLHRDEIKLQPSVLSQLLNEVEVECLPGDIPNSADVDVSGMDFTTPLFVKDLDIFNDEKITMLTDEDTVVCTLSEPTEIEEDETDEEEEVSAEVPVIGDDEE